MSAVPPESSRASAGSTEQASDRSTPTPSAAAPVSTDFGPNEWLVDEMNQRYLADPGSVDMAWWNFFADYQPPGGEPVGPQGSPATAGQATRTSPTSTRGSASPAGPVGPVGPTSTASPAGAVGSASPAGSAAAAGSVSADAPASASSASMAGPSGAAGSGRALAGEAAAAAPTTPAGPASQVHPHQPAQSGGTAQPGVTPSPSPVPPGVAQVRLRGAAARTAVNMAASLSVPTATSVRSIPAKLLIDNRIVINNHLARGRGGKVSFTHLIGFAMVRALAAVPEMNFAYGEAEGKPVMLEPEHVNLGLAIDVTTRDGARQLLVPNIKSAETTDFRHFWMAYEDVVRRARTGKLTVEDFAGTTISLTNPGTIGTEHSVPRLMAGQGCIVGVGAMEYPAAYQGASVETIARLAISKTVTLTSTYDHRIIQGAQSGEYLRVIHSLLLGGQGFYDDVFKSLRIPYEPVRWVRDIPAGHEDDISKAARVHELIHAYRVRGHLMADTDPLEYRQRKHPDLDINQHGLTLWDLEREFATGGFGGKPRMKLR